MSVSGVNAAKPVNIRAQCAGQSDKIQATLKDKFWPTLLAGYAVWPLAHVINFRFIPNSQRVLYINAVNVSILTWLHLPFLLLGHTALFTFVALLFWRLLSSKTGDGICCCVAKVVTIRLKQIY